MSEVMEKDVQSQVKELKTNKLILENFKGIRDFTIEPEGKDVTILADNGIGKTTIVDAYFWLLFNKDSQNRADFEVKTLNEDGSVKHNLNHSVEAEIQLPNETVTLRKVYYEKYTKKRGSAREEFTGHSTDYFLDSVPVQKKEFEAKIAEIIDEKTFRLLTDIRHFNENLKWNERREILLSICGEGSDQQELEDASKQQKKIKAQLKEINDELQNIPVRIDETSRSMPHISNLDKKELVNRQSQIKDAIIKKQNDKRELESGGAVATKKKKVSELEGKLQEEQNKSRGKVYEQIKKIDEEINDKRSKLHDINRYEYECKTEVEEYQERIEGIKETLQELETEYEEVKSETFEAKTESCYACDRPNSCPECGYSFVEDNSEKQEEEFNVWKANKLEDIRGQRVKANADLKSHIKQVEENKRQFKKFEQQGKEIQKEIDKLNEKKTKFFANLVPSKKETGIHKQINNLKQEVENLQASNKDAIDKAYQDIRKLETDLEGVQEQLNQLKSAENAQKRIEELEAEEKRLAREYEKYQSQLYDIENLIKAKVTNLEEKINSYFQIARFKLFDVQINEGIKETCETVVNGVPYRNLNHGMKINVGLDICETLQGYYGLKVPVIVDNAESIVNIRKAGSQMFKLVVSGKHSNLTVEVSK